MADVAAESGVWFRVRELAIAVYERYDIIDIWFVFWIGLTLFGMLIVHIITSFMRRASDVDNAQQPAARLAERNGSETIAGFSSHADSEQARRTNEADSAESCIWLNSLISWLTNGAANGSASIMSLVSVWLVALNEAVRETKGTSQQLVFERVLPGGSPPVLSNVHVRCSSPRSIVLIASVRTADTSIRVLCGRRSTEQTYTAKLLHLNGQVRAEVTQGESQLSISVQFVSAPEIRLEVCASESATQRKSNTTTPDATQIEQQRNWLETRVIQAIQESVLKLNLNTAIAPTRTPANASSLTNLAAPFATSATSHSSTPKAIEPTREPEVVAKSARPATFAMPQPQVTPQTSSKLFAANTVPAVSEPKTKAKLPQEAVALNGTAKPASTSKTPPLWSTPARSGDRRLLLKVVKASGLGAREFGCRSAHCVATVDEPQQRHQTPSVRGTVNPFWDAHFLFDLNAQSAKLTFDIYDDDGVPSSDTDACRFLGQAVLSLDVLHDVPSSRQILPLRSRPGAPDNSTGTVTVELLVLEHTDFEALPITAQAHEYTLPKSVPDVRSGTKKKDSETATNGSMSNGALQPGVVSITPAASDARRVIVETSRLETARGDIITTSLTMQEKTPADDAVPPVPQRSSSLAEKQRRSDALRKFMTSPLELSNSADYYDSVARSGAPSIYANSSRSSFVLPSANWDDRDDDSPDLGKSAINSPAERPLSQPIIGGISASVLTSPEAASPKRGSRPLSSLFRRKGGATDKQKERNESQSPRTDSSTPGTSKKNSKKQKDDKTRSKDLEQATLQNDEDDSGSLKRSKSSGMSGSFRRLFANSVRDKSKRNVSGGGVRGSKATLDSPS